MLREIVSMWISLFSHSPKARLVLEGRNWCLYENVQCYQVVEQVGGHAAAYGSIWRC